MIGRYNQATLIFALAFGLFLGALEQSKAEQQVAFSSVPFVGSAPTNIAFAKGYFRNEGLDVTITEQPAGLRALQDLFEGRADIAAVAELPVVYSMFDKRKFTSIDREDFVIFGDLVYSQDIQKLVARTDRGINSPADLIGKKIGIMKGTTIDFYMDIFFRENGLNPEQVEFVDLDTFALVEAIAVGDLDAIFTWEPHVTIAAQKLRDKSIIMSTLSGHSTAWLMVTTKKYAERNPLVLEKFLRAITH